MATTMEHSTVRRMMDMLEEVPDDRMDRPVLIKTPEGQFDLPTDCQMHWDESEKMWVLDMDMASRHPDDHQH